MTFSLLWCQYTSISHVILPPLGVVPCKSYDVFCFQIFFSVLTGATALGQAAPKLQAVSSARGAASQIYSIIDKVKWKSRFITLFQFYWTFISSQTLDDPQQYCWCCILQESQIDAFAEEGFCLDKFSGDIEFRNVSFCYPTRPDVHVSNVYCKQYD